VSLREVDASNVRAVCELELAEGQRAYVAPAAYTVAEAHYEPGATLRAIYAADEVVGLLLFEPGESHRSFHLGRMMVAAPHQGRGIGRRALALLSKELRDEAGGAELRTSCVPGPEGPTAFYLRRGFEDTGRVDHGEIVLRMPLDR
jgi:diamine N-acetyltransferase